MKDKIRAWPMENLKVLSLFLKKESEAVRYDDIAKTLGINLEKTTGKEGKSIGGILSTLRRNKYQTKPLIISLGRTLGSRRQQWRLNTSIFPTQARQEVLNTIDQLIRERLGTGEEK